MTTRFHIQLVCASYMCRKFIGYPEAVDNTHTHAHNKCLFGCLQQNASGVCAEDGQGPSSKRGYGENHPGSERRDASAKGSENVQHCTYYPKQQFSKDKEGQHSHVRAKLQALTNLQPGAGD